MAKILIVDDEEIVLRSISALLVGEGHDAVSKLSVPEAYEAMKETEFDLIITDIRMSPIDGMELMRTVHADKPDLPIIVISAYTAERIKEDSFALGCSVYLSKPFRVQDVLDAVATALKSD
jgi:CheY-like chemotaxis protein